MNTFADCSGKSSASDEFGSFEDDIDENMTRETDENGMPKVHLEQEKRLRREIANSNERRRMQSINAGFQCLKTMIPHHDGEKLSKAAILQQTADHVNSLEEEKTKLLSQNSQLKRMLSEVTAKAGEKDAGTHRSPPPKRKKRDTESSDEGISMNTGSENDEPTYEEIRREMLELRLQLDRERRLRMMLEEQTRTLESQLYPERLRQIATQVQAQMKYEEEKKRYQEEQKKVEELTRHQRQQQQNREAAFVQSSMSKRNLETIVEAIRHLEGENVLFDNNKNIPDSTTENVSKVESNSVTMKEIDLHKIDTEDCKSECSGRDSPMSLNSCDSPTIVVPPTATVPHTPEVKSNVNTQKYPIAMQLLHRPSLISTEYTAQQQRPGVIVQKSS